MLEPIKITHPPFYNPNLHKPGDLVRMWVGGKLIDTVVPELDADGNELTPTSVGRLVVEPNYKKPKFTPALKPIKKLNRRRRGG